jgi:hypothetical protein
VLILFSAAVFYLINNQKKRPATEPKISPARNIVKVMKKLLLKEYNEIWKKLALGQLG